MPERTPEQIALARQTLERIKANPQEWDQRTWRCRTAMCFAGWAVTLMGREWYAADPTSPGGTLLFAEPGEPGAFEEKAGLDRTVWLIDVGEAARRALGLDRIEVWSLFSSNIPLEWLEYVVKHIEDGKEIPAW